MIGLLCESKEIHAPAVGLKHAPSFAALVDGKSDRGQDLGVEILGGFAISDSKIDMIEKTFAHADHCSARSANCLT